MPQDVLRLLVGTYVCAVQGLDDLARNAARDDAQIAPDFLAIGRRPADIGQFAAHLAKVFNGPLGHFQRQVI